MITLDFTTSFKSDYKVEIGLDSSMIKVKSDVKTSYKQSISRRL